MVFVLVLRVRLVGRSFLPETVRGGGPARLGIPRVDGRLLLVVDVVDALLVVDEVSASLTTSMGRGTRCDSCRDAAGAGEDRVRASNWMSPGRGHCSRPWHRCCSCLWGGVRVAVRCHLFLHGPLLSGCLLCA